MKVRQAWVALAALPFAGGAIAQTVTQIDPDMDPSRSLGTNVSSAGSIHVVDGGTRAGANLFHSFSRFDLAQGDTARWVHGGGNPSGIAHVVNRVTGGLASFIDGTIDSTALPNADFWFINPSGIVFGAGARLDVPAAAHFSTASELRFEQGPAFAVATPGGSTFSVAPPAAFGFDGGQGDVVVDGAGAAFLPPAGHLTLAGRDVSVLGSHVSGAGLQLLAAGEAARELPIAGSPAAGLDGVLLVQDSSLRLARGPVEPAGIRLGGGLVVIDLSDIGTPFTDDGVSAGGPIEIVGGAIDIFASLVSSASFGAEDSGDIVLTGGDVRIGGNSIVTTDLEFGSTGFSGDIAISGDNILITESRITSSTQTDRPGGSILLEADNIGLLDGSVVGASGLPTSTGDAGNIFVRGRQLDMGPASAITSSTLGTGMAGEIEIEMAERVTLVRSSISSSADGEASGSAGEVQIRTGELELHDQSNVSTSTRGGGEGGLILVDAGGVLIDDASSIESRSLEGATADAGGVVLRAGRIDLADGGRVRSDTSGVGNGGGILIQAGEVTLTENARISSDSLAMCWQEPCTTGEAGGVAIIADRLTLTDPSGVDGLAGITSNTLGPGKAGEINLLLGALEMDGEGAVISSDTIGSGRGGAIRIDAETIAMRREAQLSTGAFGSGAGGTVDIVAGSMLMESEANIMAQSSFEDSGAGGSVIIQAGEFVMRDVAEINTNTRGSGNAGTIDIRAGTIDIDFSFIGSDSIGSGRGGAVSLTADEIRITGGGGISSDSLGSCFGPDCERAGDAGSVTVKARTLTMIGVDDGFGLDRSGISSQAFDDGHAGDVSVTADEIRMERAEIRSGTDEDGDAGTITVNAGTISLDDTSQITTSSNPFCPGGCSTAGDAGAVKIEARQSISLTRNSEISSNTTGPGSAGIVSINAGSLRLDFSSISSGTTGGGDAGEIFINADTVHLPSSGSIDSVAAFGSSGDAGSIAVTADRLHLGDFSQIASSSAGSGNGGSITLKADDLLITGAAKVLAEAFGCTPGCVRDGDGGNISITTGALVLEGTDDEFGGQPAEISTSTFGGGAAGDLAIVADRIDMNRGNIASETFTSGRAGTVTVTTNSLSLTNVSQVSTSSRGSCNDMCPDADAGSVIIRAGGAVDLRAASQITSVTRGAATAGSVDIEAGSLTVDSDSQVSSGSEIGATGRSGRVNIAAGDIFLTGGMIGTVSVNPNPAGDIRIAADSLFATRLARVTSENVSASFGFTEGDAGSVSIEAGRLTLQEGASVSTSSDMGAAGNIFIAMPQGSILRLEGDTAPGTITTSSGPGTGGRITIANPYAIISDGGRILALGEQGGANVVIDSDFFISSADRPNLVAVDGSFLLEAQVGDMSRGTVDRDLSVLDASGVLRGQCASVRRTGEVSQLVVRPVGPLGNPDRGAPAPPPLGSCL